MAPRARPERTIDDAVAHVKVDRHLAGEPDASVRALDRPASGGADRQNGGVRRIEDGGELANPMHAEIGDGAGATLQFGRVKAARAGTCREIAHLGRNRDQRFFLGAADHRGDKAAVDRHGDAHVGAHEAEHTVLGPHRVGVRHPHQSERQSLDDEVIDGEPDLRLAALRLYRGIRLFAQRTEPIDGEILGGGRRNCGNPVPLSG